MPVSQESTTDALSVARSEGVVTRADDGTFWSFVLLYLSIQRTYPVPMLCFDYGLTDAQRSWADEHLAACTFATPGDGSTGITPPPSDPFGRMLWIAPGHVIRKGLSSLFEALDSGPLWGHDVLLGWDPGRDGQTLHYLVGSAAGDDPAHLIASRWPWSPSKQDVSERVVRATTEPPTAASEAEALATLAQSIPGACASDRPAKSTQSRIRLISHVGSKSHPQLITQFIDHYARLGVDDFLVVLHGVPGDPRLEAAREALRAGGVVPVMETDVFSTPLKLERTNALMASQCSEADWIVIADVDELQVFSAPLPTLLARCDAEGYVMVQGQFVDRFADEGELAPVRADISLWEQYPWGGTVTAQVTGGWPLKVCAIRGNLRFGDGGSHSLDYGADAFRNYAATHRDPAAFPEHAQIHHFKWEQGLLGRTRDKTMGVGGDREAIDGAEFMHEYHALLAHVERHGRLRVEDAEFIGQPPLHYVHESVLISQD